ncbi:MAG: rod shape-determining protein MreD [Prevotella sp.]|nr:rod shape-determining protein MreD [Prevotella sp.]
MRYAIYIIVLTLLQAFIFGRIHLFGVATPLVYVYFVLRMPRDVGRIPCMLMSFLLGLAIDIFANTPGLATCSMTLVAFLQPYVLSMYLRNEDPDNYLPTLHHMGFVRYLSYALILLFIYCVAIFTLDAFSFAHWQHWLLCTAGSLLLTLILIISTETIRS